MNQPTYDADEIQVLEGLEAIRKSARVCIFGLNQCQRTASSGVGSSGQQY